jgi:hypothetical protein
MTPNQKKILGIVILVIVIPIQLLFIFSVVYILIDGDQDKWETTTSFLFTIGLFFFPAWWGFRLWKEGASKKREANEPIDPKIVVDACARIELDEYRKLIFRLSYVKPGIIYVHLIGLIMITSYLINGNGNYFILFIVLFLLAMPLIVYRTANSNYKATKMVHENINYQFTPETISITGETFNSTVQWKSLHKVKEVNAWFLLYTSKQVALLVPKRSFRSQEDVHTFRKLAKV